MSNPSFHYVIHKETQEQAVRIQEGTYDGVVYQYADVMFPIYDDEGEAIDPQSAEEIPLTFKWKVLYNPNKLDMDSGEFGAVAGDILLELIEEGLENDAITVNTEGGENDTSSSDLE